MVTDLVTDQQTPVQLRRYPNRRYYDAAHSQHLTLEEIFRLIAGGQSVQVNDSKSGEDITTRVLAQLILEQAPGKWAALPAELLHQIIRANEALLREFVEKYFHRALLAFEASQREFEQYMRQALGLSHDLLAMNPGPWSMNPGKWSASWAAKMLEPYMRTFLAGDDASPAAALPLDAGQENAELKTAVAELKRELEELRIEMRKQ